MKLKSSFSRGEENTLYCEFEDAESFVEFYDLNSDPFQLENAADGLGEEDRKYLSERMRSMTRCVGKECSENLNKMRLIVGNAEDWALLLVVCSVLGGLCIWRFTRAVKIVTE